MTQNRGGRTGCRRRLRTCCAALALDTRLAQNSTRVFECCSGLVDLVVCVGRNGGGGHRLTLAGERFVGLVAEDVAEGGDGGGEFRGRPPGHWNCRRDRGWCLRL